MINIYSLFVWWTRDEHTWFELQWAQSVSTHSGYDAHTHTHTGRVIAHLCFDVYMQTENPTAVIICMSVFCKDEATYVNNTWHVLCLVLRSAAWFTDNINTYRKGEMCVYVYVYACF